LKKNMSDRNKKRKNSPSDFLRYKRGEMSGEERNSFEREIQKDPFTEESSEGFEALSPDEVLVDLEKLNKRLNSRTSGKRRYIYYRIAASVALLMVISAIFILLEKGRPEMELAVAEKNIAAIEIIKGEPVTLPSTAYPKKEENGNITKSRKAESVTEPAAGEIITEEAVSVKKEFGRAERNELIETTRTPKADVHLADERIATPATVTKSRSSELLQVKGKVITSDNNMPLPGATISIKGTTKGAVTDASGNFSITVPDSENRTLVASYIGMDSKEFEAKADSQVQVELRPSVSALSEVVVVGYGTQRDEVLSRGYVAPQPVKGMPDFDNYIKENIIRPDTMTTGQRVVVVLSFLVKADGKIDSIKIVKSPGKSFSDEAIRLIKSGPQWKAAEQNGKVIEDEVRLRIVFR
jgi:hypothetical protein